MKFEYVPGWSNVTIPDRIKTVIEKQSLPFLFGKESPQQPSLFRQNIDRLKSLAEESEEPAGARERIQSLCKSFVVLTGGALVQRGQEVNAATVVATLVKYWEYQLEFYAVEGPKELKYNSPSIPSYFQMNIVLAKYFALCCDLLESNFTNTKTEEQVNECKEYAALVKLLPKPDFYWEKLVQVDSENCRGIQACGGM